MLKRCTTFNHRCALDWNHAGEHVAQVDRDLVIARAALEEAVTKLDAAKGLLADLRNELQVADSMGVEKQSAWFMRRIWRINRFLAIVDAFLSRIDAGKVTR